MIQKLVCIEPGINQECSKCIIIITVITIIIAHDCL